MRHAISSVFMALSLIVFLFVGCSDDDDTVTNGGEPSSAQETIGPEGGIVELPGQAKLIIPPGAVSDTLEFTITVNDTITPPYIDWGFLSPAFTITPTPLTFDSAATLTLWYNPSNLGGAEETDIDLYTYTGLSWQDLSATVNTADNYVSAPVFHLSEFAAMADTSSPENEGVYSKLVVGRHIIYMGQGEPTRVDAFTATFDSAYAPCDPVQPIGSVAVTCNGNTLVYDEICKMHQYPEDPSPATPIIEPGTYYTFEVTGDDRVPTLTEGIAFPVYEPYLTYPTIFDTVSAYGFEITWQGGGGGTVELIFMSGDSQIFFLETNNDGSHAVSSDQLAGLSPGQYSVILNHYERNNILATGYDSRSFISGRVMSTSVFQLQ